MIKTSSFVEIVNEIRKDFFDCRKPEINAALEENPAQETAGERSPAAGPPGRGIQPQGNQETKITTSSWMEILSEIRKGFFLNPKKEFF